jgi:UDP:flavonoid glycosyltransferase YjiC (YdhE family)
MLALLGFGDPGKLAPMLQAWDTLLDLFKPDLVVADHAPALIPLLNARGLPAIALGNGFTLPPLTPQPFPPLSSHRAPAEPEARLFETLGGALTSLGYRAPQDWRAAFQTRERLVFSARAFDPYQSLRSEPLLLPPEQLPHCTPPPVAPRVFAYLGAELPGVTALLQALTLLDCPLECYLRGVPDQVLRFLTLRGAIVHTTPPDLADRLPLASHVLSQGGTGMAHSALAAGRPHGIFALHGESRINAQALTGLGAGALLGSGPLALPPEKILPELQAFLADPALRGGAQEAGKALHLGCQTAGLRAVSEALARVMATV